MTHQLTGLHLINGTWIKSQSGEGYEAISPATGAKLTPTFAKAAAPEVDAALSIALKTFEQTSDLPPRWTATLLDSIADHIMDLGDALLDRGEQETALP